MKKRLLCAWLAVCLLSGIMIVPAQAEAQVFSNTDDLLIFLQAQCAGRLAEEIQFGYTEALDDVLGDAYSAASMIYNLGIMTFRYEQDEENRRAAIREIEYYPGFRAAQAWTLGRTDELSSQEQELLAEAGRMAEAARAEAQSPYELLVRLHDLLAEKVSYMPGGEDGSWDEGDTAVGALLFGQADCDGYADAFYLLCTLAGFPVQLQHGKTLAADGSEEWHKWNAVQWDGKWYHADVTWDDVDYPEAPSATAYPYFLVGSSMMNAHSWVREVSLCDQEEYTDWNAFYYTADRSGLTLGAYFSAVERAADYAVYMQSAFGRKSIHVMVDGNQTGQAQMINDLLTGRGMQGRWYLWGRAVGDYTCLSITVLEEE